MSVNDDASAISEDLDAYLPHSGDEYTLEHESDVGDLSSIDDKSFLDLEYTSDEFSKIVGYHNDDLTDLQKLYKLENSDIRYDRHHVLPQWIIKSEGFKSSKLNDDDCELDDILRLLPESRSNDQNSKLVNFVMSVWDVAKNMGYSQVNGMVKSFKYLTYHHNNYIFEEGQRGLTFYIIIRGACDVIKDGIGVVATLEKGQSFGEIALTQGKDLRTASILCSSKQVDVLSLHKIDYDRYVKDIQISENKEHYGCLKACPLFLNWSRQLLEKISRTCFRKRYAAGEYVYRLNDEANLLYMLLEGNVSIIKTVSVTSVNRWPTGMNSWDHKSHSITKNYNVASLCNLGDYFGEISLIRGCNRTETVLCNADTTLVCLDKLEFLHLIDSGKAEIATALNSFTETQKEDEERARKVVTMQRKASTVGNRKASIAGGRKSSVAGSRKSSTVGMRKASLLDGKKSNSIAATAALPASDPLNKESAKSYFSNLFNKPVLEEGPVAAAPEYMLNPETLSPLKRLPFATHCPILFGRRSRDSEDESHTITFSPFIKRLDTGVSSSSSLNGVITQLQLVDKDGRKSHIKKPITMTEFMDHMQEMSVNTKKSNDRDDATVNSYSSQGNVSLGSSLTNSQMSYQSMSTSMNSMNTLLLNSALPVTPIKKNKLQPTHLLHKAKLTYRDVLG